MPVVTPNLVAGSGFTLGPNGARDVFGYHVAGLPGGDGIRVQGYNALPYHYGDTHPTDPNLFATQFTVDPFLKSKTEVLATITFLPPDFSNLNSPIIRFNGWTEKRRTNFNYDRSKILVEYTPSGGSKIGPHLGEVQGSKAMGVLSVERTVTTMDSSIFTYLNKINSTIYQGQAAFTWFVKEISMEKHLYRPGYRQYIELVYDEDTHIKTAVYRDTSGFIPGDVPDVNKTLTTPQNGWTNARPNGTANLTGLLLPAVF